MQISDSFLLINFYIAQEILIINFTKILKYQLDECSHPKSDPRIKILEANHLFISNCCFYVSHSNLLER